MLNRLYPSCGRLTQSPLDIFSLLWLGHGFAPAELYSEVTRAWEALTAVHPFQQFRWTDRGKNAITVWYDDADPRLPITRDPTNPLLLKIDMAQAEALGTYLADKKIRYDAGGGTEVAAAKVWPRYGRTGRNGCLVAVLVKDDEPGELYQVYPSPNYPVPLVAVTVNGNYWTKVLARAVGQTLGGLFDEYDLPGSEYEVAPAGIDLTANLLFLTSDQRARLVNGENPANVLKTEPPHWRGGSGPLAPRFYKAGDPPPAYHRKQFVNYYEGGGGYRRNVLRSAYDCLLRRRPHSLTAPIQDDIDFCVVCRRILEFAMRGDRDYKLTSGRRVLLDSQQLHYDEIGWAQTRKITGPMLKSYTTRYADGSASGPHWSCDIVVNDTVGLQIANLQLANRPGDMFTAAKDVLKQINFRDLAIEFAGFSYPPLAIKDAFANALDPPVLEIAENGNPEPGTEADAVRPYEYKMGVKLRLSWDLRDSWAVDAAMTLVLRGKKNDFDPGGAAMACKFYPELSLRYRPPSRGSAPRTRSLPQVVALKGTVVLVCNNVIPTSLAGPLPSNSGIERDMQMHLNHMATGKLAIALITDTNSSDDDSVYQLINVPIPPPVRPLIPSAPTSVPTGRWISGRKLAGVVESLDPRQVGGTVARIAHVLPPKLPVLPHWSWLFDYGIPKVTGTKQFVAVYAQDEPKGKTVRETKIQWPPVPSTVAAKPLMTIRKTPRQGAYDNMHVNAAMHNDSKGRPIVAAPFCADLCLHIHWRWGTVATASGTDPHPFLGWGDGRGNQGKNTLRGGMLIPSNQHLDVEVENRSDAEAHIRYIVTAHKPKQGAAQVILDQGVGFAFSYDGIAREQRILLAPLALGLNLHLQPEWLAVVSTQIQYGLQSREYELAVRHFFDKIYATIRWYDDVIDGTNVQQFPGDPTKSLDPTQPVYPPPPAMLEDL